MDDEIKEALGAAWSTDWAVETWEWDPPLTWWRATATRDDIRVEVHVADGHVDVDARRDDWPQSYDSCSVRRAAGSDSIASSADAVRLLLLRLGVTDGQEQVAQRETERWWQGRLGCAEAGGETAAWPSLAHSSSPCAPRGWQWCDSRVGAGVSRAGGLCAA